MMPTSRHSFGRMTEVSRSHLHVSFAGRSWQRGRVFAGAEDGAEQCQDAFRWTRRSLVYDEEAMVRRRGSAEGRNRSDKCLHEINWHPDPHVFEQAMDLTSDD